MRKLFFFFIIIISCFQIRAQDSSKIQKQIDSLQKRLEETNYTRVPKQDFEKILKNSIENEVSDSIKKWIAFLGTLIALVGVFIAAYFKTQIRLTMKLPLKIINHNSKEDNKINFTCKKKAWYYSCEKEN